MFDKEFVRGGAILVICFGISNMINFGFHFSMARLLSLSDYGVLATLLSIIYLLALFSESIQTFVSKYASHTGNSIVRLMGDSTKKISYLSVGFFLAYLILSIPLSIFLNISYFILSLNGLMIFGAFYMPINRGLLQGKKKFLALGGNMVFESVVKFVLSLVLVLAGMAVYGAIIGGLLGAAFAYALSFINLRPLLKSSRLVKHEKIVYDYGKESFLTILAIMVFFSIDIVIARIVFEPEVVGSYAIASTVAKTIFFAAQPLSKAMFSFTAGSMKDNQSKKIFFNTLALIGTGITIALILFYFFSDFWIYLFSGKTLPSVSHTLFILGMGYGLMALTNAILFYKISTNKIRSVIPLLLMPVIEVVLLFSFSDNLTQFSFALVAGSALFFWVSLATNSR